MAGTATVSMRVANAAAVQQARDLADLGPIAQHHAGVADA